METRRKIIKKLSKDVIPGINLFEAVLFAITTIVGCVLFSLTLTIWKDGSSSSSTKDLVGYVITLVDIPIGIIAATFLSKRSKIAPGLLAVDAILYGTSNFLAGNIALGIVNAILTPVIYFVALFFIWPRETKNGSMNVETRKLNYKSGLLLVLFVVILAIIFGFLLPWILPQYFHITNYKEKWLSDYKIWFDSFAAALMLFAVIMGTLRFRETFILYLISNILKTILFATTVIVGYKNDLLLLLLAVAYFINAVFGIMVWSQESDNYTKKDKIRTE